MDRDDAKEKAAEILAKGMEMADKAKHAAEGLAEKAKDAGRGVAQGASNAYKAAEDGVSDVLKRANEIYEVKKKGDGEDSVPE